MIKSIYNRIKCIESKLRILEAKQVGTIYHVCTLNAYLKYILPNDTLEASGKYYNWVYGGDDYVSFTRDKYFVVGTKSVQSSKVLVQLVIDGDKLSEHYKIGPYNDFAFDQEGNLVDDSNEITKREKEEAVKGPIKNLSKYIKEIRFDVFDIDQSTINMIKRAKLDPSKVRYYHFIKNYQAKSATEFMKKHGILNGCSLSEALSVFKDYMDREKFDELLFSGDVDDIKKAIRLGADLNEKYPSGYAAENYCYNDVDADILDLLLSKGANANLNSNGSPLICVAAECGNIDAVKVLLSHGADINDRDANGYTPFLLAVKSKDKNMMDYLAGHGADINAVANDGISAMSLAKTKVMMKMLQKLGVA